VQPKKAVTIGNLSGEIAKWHVLEAKQMVTQRPRLVMSPTALDLNHVPFPRVVHRDLPLVRASIWARIFDDPILPK
jgi:hypothetical protein